MKVCIDPGHPSESGLGCHGRRIDEVDLVWQLARRLKPRLERESFACRMTKHRARERVSNRRRAQIASEFNADLLLRLHCDANSGSGFALYFPDRPGRTPEGFVGPSKRVCRESREAARSFHKAFAKILAGLLEDNGVLPDTCTAIGSKQGALTGSIHATQAVVLVEICVLTNPDDEDKLLSKAGFERVVEALAAGCRAVVADRQGQDLGSNPKNRSVSGRWESQ